MASAVGDANPEGESCSPRLKRWATRQPTACEAQAATAPGGRARTDGKVAAVRCFIAVELDPAIREAVGRLQGKLSLPGVAVRWVRPEQMHITLKFLGEVDDQVVPLICEAVAEVARQGEPFDLHVRGTGCFPPRGRDVRVVWAGLSDETGRMERLYTLLEATMTDLGFPPERRPFSPHLTLGRAKSPRQATPLREHVAGFDSFDSGVQAVDSVILFESRLRKTGAEYTVVVRERLG